MEFMKNTIEYSKSRKASHKVDEIREVPESHYVCQWWIQQLQGIEITNNTSASAQFKKKHRDQIRLTNGLDRARGAAVVFSTEPLSTAVSRKKKTISMVYDFSPFLLFLLSPSL